MSVCSPRGQRWQKWQFSDYRKTTFFSLAMVIRNVMTIASEKMTIAATPKTILVRAENSGEKGGKYPYFVKDCYFCRPHDGPKRPRKPRKPSWIVEKFQSLSPQKRALRLYIYTLLPRVLHKYTAACKGFSRFLLTLGINSLGAWSGARAAVALLRAIVAPPYTAAPAMGIAGAGWV